MASAYKFHDGTPIEDELSHLRMKQILEAGAAITVFSRGDKRKRANLIETISSLTAEQQRLMRIAASAVSTKCKRGPERPAKCSRTDAYVVTDQLDVGTDIQSLISGKYMKTASKQVIEESIAAFIDRSNNASLATRVCIVCASEKNARDMEPTAIESIPCQDVLKPEVAHPSHQLTRGMLLHFATTLDRSSPQICAGCMCHLWKQSTPPESLANGMWIGPIPHELSVLTLPERLLVARYFPAAYIVKLFPKQKGASSWDRDTLNSGIRGNVCTY